MYKTETCCTNFIFQKKTSQAFSESKAEIEIILNNLIYILENRALLYFGTALFHLRITVKQLFCGKRFDCYFDRIPKMT